jgi:flagellar biosynthesis protein FlhF
MQIKSYEAKDMTTALRLIKRELGPDAVILSARTLKKENKIFGLVRSVGVEVTAAVDTYRLPAASNSIANTQVLANYARNKQNSRPRNKTIKTAVSSKIKALADRQPAQSSANRTLSSNKDLGADLFQHLISQGVSRDIAHDLARAAKKQVSNAGCDLKNQIIAEITAILEQKRTGVEPVLPPKSNPEIMAFIGPTGVGKTTTAAKLAARHAIEENKKVALISLDGDGVGALEALKIYGRAIGIPVISAGTPSAFKKAIHQFRQYDLILVDTPGFSNASPEELDTINAFFNGIDTIQIHLLLSAGAKEDDLVNILRRVEKNAAQYLIFTKLDESFTYGNLVNILVDTKLPLSFLTTGRHVPKSIEIGTMQKMMQYLLGSFAMPLALSDSQRQNGSHLESSHDSRENGFVANKNSDVFHSPDCKWTRKIKAKNMISFASVREAKNHHFMPCRDCQPSPVDALQTGLDAGGKGRISSYL